MAPGNIFYKLRAGTIQLDHYGIQFEEDSFEDGEEVKWLCLPCSSDRGVGSGYVDEEYCTICGQQFDFDELDICLDILVRIEEVRIRVGRTGLPVPDYSNEGHLHLLCAVEDWSLPLCDWNLERDVPSCP